MALLNSQTSYLDSATRPLSILDAIEMISARENGLLSMLPKSKATDTVHSTIQDTLRTGQSRAVAEGADATLLATTNPVRTTNLTEIVSIPFAVTGTQRAIEHLGEKDAFVREERKALMDWSNAAEFDLMRSTLVSGVSGTVPKMRGVISSTSTNTTAQTSGTVFSESIFNGLLQLTWTNSNGEVATDIFVGAALKKKISGFSGRSTSQVIVEQTTAINTVDYYVSDFGEHRVHLHRYVFVSGTDATTRILGIRPEKFGVAYLREPRIEELAKTGDTTKAQVIGELTLEAKNQVTGFFASGYHLTS